MKKIGLICATLLAGLSLSACNNLASQSHKVSSSSSSTKVVKKLRKNHKKAESRVNSQNKTRTSSASNAQNADQNSSSQQNNATASSQSDDSWSDVDKALNQPYKGYPTYRDYLNANGGDPDEQRQTDQMQTQQEIQDGYANPDGTPTAKGQSLIDAYNNGAFGGPN